MSNRFNKDGGFSGTTHALSAIAVLLIIVSFFGSQFARVGLDFNRSPVVLLYSIIMVSGGAYIVDFDNTQSTAKSHLGILGDIMSYLFRGSSNLIYDIRHTKYDEKNPHRQFWHSIISIIILSLILYGLFSINIVVYNGYSLGTILMLLWIVLVCRLSLVTFFKKFVNKKRKTVIGNILLLIISCAIAGIFFYFLPDIRYQTIVLTAMGSIIHIFGDCFTAEGSPLLGGLIRIKGKLWYKISLLSIRSGGDAEQSIIVPLLLILIVVSGLKLILSYLGVI